MQAAQNITSNTLQVGHHLQEAAWQDKSAVRAAVAACGATTWKTSMASVAPVYVVCNAQYILTNSILTCNMGTPI